MLVLPEEVGGGGIMCTIGNMTDSRHLLSGAPESKSEIT
jgi:hypothetical protein